MNAAQSPIAAPFDARSQAKSLLRIARTGALATLDRASGAPLTTLVAVGSDYNGAPLFSCRPWRNIRKISSETRAALCC